MSNNRTKPTLRFAGFTDDWERRKLPEFVDFFNGLTYSPDDVQDTGTLVLRSSNVKNGEIIDADNVYVNPEIVNSEFVRDGDVIVVVRNGSRALIGKHAVIRGNMPNTVIGAFMSGIRTEESSFVNALLDTQQFEKEIAKNMGATINQITGYMFSQMEFMIPSSAEQEHIGVFFELLDNLIAQHQRQYDRLLRTKKAMLLKMFPRPGKNVPEIRFAGFTSAWEQRKLRDLIRQPVTDGPHETPVLQDEGIPFLSVEAIHDGIIDVSKCRGFISKEDDEKYKKKYIPEIGDVYFTKAATIGRVAVVRTLGFNIWSPIGAIKPNNKLLSSNYLFYYLQTDAIQEDAIIASNNGTQHNLAMDAIENFDIQLPTEMQEQECVSAFLLQFDNLITLHQRKLSILSNLKKAMLQKMFPVVGRK